MFSSWTELDADNVPILFPVTRKLHQAILVADRLTITAGYFILFLAAML